MILCANPSAQFYSYQSEIESAVISVMRGNRYILGAEVEALEEEFATYIGTSYAVGVANGTDAIELALRALDIKNGDEVITVSHTAVATVAAIEASGATPVLVDVEQQFYTLEPTQLEEVHSSRTKAVIAVHLYGQSVNIEAIKYFCNKHNIFLIEDTSQAHGAFYKDKRLGSIGDIGCLSFNANKIITTGSGGAIITNNKKFYEKAQYLASQAKDDSFSYIHNECGYNYKMNSISAALGISQLRRLKKKIILREKIHKRYLLNFKNSKIINVLPYDSKSRTNYWMNVISFKKLNFKQIHDLSFSLSKKKIETRRIWRPIHLQLHIKKFQKYKVANATKLYSSSLCVPSDDNISNFDVDKISNYIKKFHEIIDNN